MIRLLHGSGLKRTALITALAAVGVAALLGVVALLGGGFGDVQGKILVTSLLVTGGAIVSLGCAVALEANRLGPIPYVGVAASILSFGMLIVGLWAEADVDAYWKSAVTLLVVALAIALAGLLDLARLERTWPLQTAHALTAASAVLVLVALWAEIGHEVYWRATGVVLVLFAAATVAVPILHRMADIPTAGEASVAAPDVAACPFCGGDVQGRTATAVTCPACGRRWRVTLE